MRAKLVSEVFQYPYFSEATEDVVDIFDVVQMLDSLSELEPYKNEFADSDGIFYIVPYKAFKKYTGWDKERIDEFNENNHFGGEIFVSNGNVYVKAPNDY